MTPVGMSVVSTRSWWPVTLAAGGAAAVVFGLLPNRGLVQDLLLTAMAVVAAASVVLRLRRERSLDRRPWLFLALGLLCYSIATCSWTIWQQFVGPLPFPSPVDLAYLLTYGLFGAFLVSLICRTVSEEGRSRQVFLGLVDAGIFTCAALSVLWPHLVSPSLADPTVTAPARLAAATYPLLLSFLLGLVLHLAVSGIGRNAVGLLILTWIGGELGSEILYSFSSLSGETALGHPRSLGWIASYSSLVALSVHPDLLNLDRSASQRKPPRTRAVWLLLAGPLTPMVVALLVLDTRLLGTRRETLFALAFLTLAGFVLVICRLQLVSGDLAEQNRLAGELAEAVARLEANRDELAPLAAVVASTQDAVITTSPDGTIVGWNGGAERLYGYTAEEALGQHVAMVSAPEQAEVLRSTLCTVAGGQPVTTDTIDLRKDGSRVETSVTVSNIYGEAGEVTGMVGIARDITARKRAEAQAAQDARELAEQADQLSRLAFRDPLTGLANRALLNDRLTHALAGRGSRKVSLLLLDLDEFKTVNDVSGHAAGDELLVEVARRLRSCLRPGDTVARLGGDEFAIVVEATEEPTEVAERILEHLAAPVALEGRQAVPQASIGVATTSGGDMAVGDLMRRADVAMYAAKAAGKGRYSVFRPDMEDALVARADLEAALQQAVGQGEIVVHYQPIVEAQAGKMVRLEALVRWHRPSGLVAPGEFLPLAEETGLIVEIGEAVLRRSCEQLSHWLRDDAQRSVAVNVSPLQLRVAGFTDRVMNLLDDTGVRAGQLVLEVTETLFLEADAEVLHQLTVLRDHGIHISIDDFGTGYSSLGRLQALPVSSMKIDMSFVQLVETGNEDLPILTSMIVMAHSLGLEVTAEGVETPRQAERLMALGCEHLQGYYLGRPQPFDGDDALGRAAEAAMVNLGGAGSTGVRPLVLVIEDEAVIRGVVRVSLSSRGFEVEEASSGAEGLELAVQLRPECLLIDLGLPDMDGVAVVAEARAKPELADTAIVVLTGAAERETKVAAFRAGADDYIVKPVLAQHLPARIRGAIRAARSAKRTTTA